MVRGTAYVLFVLLSLATARAQETSVETPKSALTAGEREAPSEAQQSICLLIESAAHSNGLPVEFFVRLIWQESRFRADAVGPVTRNGKRALGIAQFMPGTAAERDLLDPLNPIKALPKAAEFLKDLRRQFGNLGLAAAAYNAGPRRVREWMAGESPMPSETRAYVQAVTGTSVNQWATGGDLNSKGDTEITCDKAMALLKRAPTTFIAALEQRVVSGAIQPWGQSSAATDRALRFWPDIPHYSNATRRYWGDATQSYLNAGEVRCLGIKSGWMLKHGRLLMIFAIAFIRSVVIAWFCAIPVVDGTEALDAFIL